ncbi:MAG: alpha-amylase family glycosyl hydrolase [Chitinophagales bacterium]|nr:alpha-amylase family glycosyl hydrolase [Chitinophagales bacterium]MDW8428451.1 alpha-amylase family glycosyl hydrolase [Chitinophagales bacterium]
MQVLSLFVRTVVGLLFIASELYAQVVWTYPHFPTVNSAVTIFYDASKGNGALKNFTGDIYIHTGVITNQSSSPTDWKHVVTTWGVANAAWKMTPLGNNLYAYHISNITTFYNISANETVLKLAMVFRNANGTVVGRDTDGSDLFADVWDGVSQQVRMLRPAESPTFVSLSDVVEVTCVSSLPGTLTIFHNGIWFYQQSNTDSITAFIVATSYGASWLKVTAGTAADSAYYVVNPPLTLAPLPQGADDGITFVNDSTATLVLPAPGKQFIYVVGDFSDWLVDSDFYMKRTPDGTRWWITISGLQPLKEYRYQFWVDGHLRVADPYCRKILDPYHDKYIPAATYPNLLPYPTGKTSGIVSVLQTGKPPYNWQVPNFPKPNPDNLVIYELLVRDFIAARNWKTLKDTLNYLKTLGVTAIELMPFNEFEGNDSWGYNPSFYFAPDKYYGPADDLKAFIDACHQMGIAVIQDIALNHCFSQSPHCQLYWDAANFWPSADNIWLNTDCDPATPGYQGKHPFGVGYDFNHESPYTQKLVDDVLRYWVTEFKIDGFRFDLSKGFTQTYSGSNVGLWGQYDQSRINLLKRMADQIRAVDPDVILILEHFADNSEEKVLSDYGFYLWGNLNYAYAQSAMGYSSGADISWINYHNRGWSDPHVVGYMESHDEERLMYKTITYGNSQPNYSVKPLDSALNRMKLASLLFILVPGPKMIWQFGELGYDYSINYGGSNVTAKPIRWDYFQYNPRRWLYYFYKALIDFKNTHAVATTKQFSLVGGGLKKNLRLYSDTLNVVILGNFDIYDGSQYPYFPHTGWWYEYLTGDSLYVTDVNAQLFLKAGAYRFYTDKKLSKPYLGNVGIEATHLPPAPVLEIFPNPASQAVVADFYVPAAGPVMLVLYDAHGRLIRPLDQNTRPQGWYTLTVPLSGLSSGIYELVFFCAGQRIVQKLIVNH